MVKNLLILPEPESSDDNPSSGGDDRIRWNVSQTHRNDKGSTLSNFDRHAFTEDLGTAAQYVPRKGMMDAIVFELMKLGYGAANVADGWRKINLPEASLVIQLELGEPVNQDLLSCVVLNGRVHEGHYFPLVSTDYDRYDFVISHKTAQEISTDIDNFYRAAVKFAKESA